MFGHHGDRLKGKKESRRRRHLEMMDPPSADQVQLGRDALNRLRETVPQMGLGRALSDLSAIGISVRPNVWQDKGTGAWVLNGIRFTYGETHVTTGVLRASKRFGPEGDLAFAPERDGQIMHDMLVAYERGRGRTVGGATLPDQETGQHKPKMPKAEIPWLPVSEAPTIGEIYGLLVHEGGQRTPVVMRGTRRGDAFIPVVGAFPSGGWRFEGWLAQTKACVPGTENGGMADAELVLMRGAGISDGLRDMIHMTHAGERELDLFEYRMTVGKDAWSHIKTADLRPMAVALCSAAEMDRIDALPVDRRRHAMRSIGRGFEPVYAIDYEEKRLGYLRRRGGGAPTREEPDYPQL